MQLNLNRLKAERIAKGKTQEVLAKELGKSRIWYLKRESGRVPMGADDLAEIATALGVDNLNIFFT